MTAVDAPPEPRTGAELPPHRRRRRRLLAWSAPVVLAVLVTGSLLLGTWLGNLLGTRHYDAGRFPQATAQYQAQQRWTGFAEQWKAWFNSGTAHYRAEEHFLAVEDLRVALELVPEAGPLPDGPEGSKAPDSPECRVRTNLSLAVEAMGDVAATDEDQGMAAAYYAEAQDVIAPCTTSPQNTESSERQKDKEEQARQDRQQPEDNPTDQPSGDPTDEPTDEPSAEPSGEPSDEPSDQPSDEATDEPSQEPSDEPDPQREELEQRNREAERDRQEQQERGGGGFGGGQNW